MSPPADAERRPASNEAANEGSAAAASQGQHTPSGISAADAGRLACRADHALLVVVGTPHGHARSRVFLTVAAADRAVQNARRRGAPAQLALVRLTPVCVSPDALEELLAGGEGR